MQQPGLVYTDNTSILGDGSVNDPLTAAVTGLPPGAPNTAIQFNDAGAFGGDPNLTWDKTSGSFVADSGGLGGTVSQLTDTLGGQQNGLTITDTQTQLLANITGSLLNLFCDGNLSLTSFNGDITATVGTAKDILLLSGSTQSNAIGVSGDGGTNGASVTANEVGGSVAIEADTDVLIRPNVNGAGGKLQIGQTGGAASGEANFNGVTSGSAEIGVADVAGTPNRINLPVATGAANSFLKTNGANPQQTIWELPSIDVAPFFPGVPANAQIVYRIKVSRAMKFPAGAALSTATAGTAATASTTFSIQKNGVTFATVNFPSTATGAYTQAADANFVAGDILEFLGPATADATLADIGFSLAGFKV